MRIITFSTFIKSNCKSIFTLFFSFTAIFLSAQSTSWKGTSNTNWKNASNWTNGIPTSTVNAILGDANFTGSFQPKISRSATAKSITIGGSKATTLTLTKALNVSGDITINSGSTVSLGKTGISLKGNWVNNGTFTPTHNNAKVTFSGSLQTISGSTATSFRNLIINASDTVTLGANIAFTGSFTMNGVLDPLSYKVTGSAITVGSVATLRVRLPLFSDNYSATSPTLAAGSTVSYIGNVNQTVLQTLTYSTLAISGAGYTKTLGGNLGLLISSDSSKGRIVIASGTFDIAGFTCNRGTTKTGGSFQLSNGATLKIGSTRTFPTGFNAVSLAATSTVEYYGGAQTVTAYAYGNLTLSSTATTITKTLPALTIYGDLTTSTTSTGLVANINTLNVLGNVTIGANSTLAATTFTVTVSGNYANSGAYTATTGTIIFNGANKVISGAGTNTFNNITFSGTGITTSGTVNIGCAGNVVLSGGGTFTNGTGTFTMSGSGKTITGAGISFNDFTISAGSVSTAESFGVSGNLSATGSLTASAGTITFSGTSKNISGAGAKTLFNTTFSGTYTIGVDMTVNGGMSVSTGGSLTGTAGIVTFSGNSSLGGTANLFSVTSSASSFNLGANAVLGVASVLTLTSGFNATSNLPNMVIFNGSGTQSIPAATYYNLSTANGGTKSVNGIITVNGTLNIGTSTTLSQGSFSMNVVQNWENNGTFTKGNQPVVFSGSSISIISGTNTFNNITVNKSTSSYYVLLSSNISTDSAVITSGFLRTGSNTLTITAVRSGNGLIFGNIKRQHSFTTGVPYAFEGPSNTISFSSVSSVTEITVSVFDGTQVIDYPNGTSINRYYNISVPSGTYTATLRLHYENGELNGNKESTMQLRNYNGSNYTLQTNTGNDTIANYVEKSGLTSITNKWTIADGDNIIAWRGYTNTDWATASNWRIISGSPANPPSSADVAIFGDSAIVNQPTVSSSAVAKSLYFKSAAACTLTVSSGGSVDVNGNISGEWTGNRTHNINIGSQTLIAGGIIMSDNTSGHDINISANGGSITVKNDITLSGSAALTLQNSSSLNIAGNYFNYLSGTFSAGASTVTFNGTAVQQLPGLSFYNLTINKASGISRAVGNLTVGGNLTITAGTFILDSNVTVAGNISIAAAGNFYFNNTHNTVTLNGNLTNNGNMFSTGSNFIMAGTGAQNIFSGSFHDLSINKASGTAAFTSNNTIGDDLSILSGTLDLGTYTGNRAALGGIFSMNSGASILVGGSNNFPSNYSTYTLNAASTTTYNGTGTQTIKDISYGHLVLSNGASNAKTLNSNAFVLGNLTISSGATLSTSFYLLSVAGDWINNGTFNASSGIVSLEGTSKSLNGTTTFNKLNVNGSYTVNNVSLTFNDQVEVTGTFTTGNGTMTVIGNLINRGSISNNGVVTFAGTQAQTIRLINALISSSGTVNFNGNVAPVLSSNTSPQYLNLNINNTAGVSPSVAWDVFGAFTVASGSAFNGGPYVHTFYGNFTNNGTVTTKGTMRFSPSASAAVNFGSNFSSTGIVDLFGSGVITLSGSPVTLTNLTIRNTNPAGLTPNQGWTVNGNFTIASNSIFNASTFTYNIDSSFTCNGTLNAGTSTFNFRGTTSEISSNGTFYNIQIDNGAIVEALNDVFVSHDFVKNGTYIITDNVLVFTGSGNSRLSSSSYPFSLGYLDVKKTSTSDTVKLGGRIDLIQSINIASGVMDADTFSVFEDAGNQGEFNIDSLAIYITKRITSPIFPSFTTTTVENYSTIEYGSRTGGSQAINTTLSYGHLKLSGKGPKTANAALLVNNNFILSGGNFIAGSFTDTVKGNWIMTGDTFTSTATTTILLNGTGLQTVSSTGAFNNLTINKPTGGVTCSTNVTVSGILALTSGIVSTGSNAMIVTNTNTSSVVRTSGWVNGFLRRSIPVSASALVYNYFIGDSTNYTPVSITFASLSGAGTLTGSTIGTEHPNASSSGLNTAKGVNRYYTFTNSGIAFTSYSATFNFVAGDLDAGVTAGSLKAGKYTSGAWTLPTSSANSTSFSVSGVTSFSDFIACEAANKGWDGGATTLNWNDAANWSPDGVPTLTESVSIVTNTGTVLVNTSAASKDLTLGNASGFGLQITTGNSLTVNDVLTLTSAGININGQTLTLNGSFNASGSGSITGSNTSNLIIGGTGAFGILRMNQANLRTTNRLNNLTFNRTSGTLSINDTLQIIGVISPVAGTFTTNGKLVLAADSSTIYGQVAPFVSGGNISGSLKVEKMFNSTTPGWRQICLPVKDSISNIVGLQVQTTANPKTNQHSIFWWDASLLSNKTAKGWTTASNTDTNARAYSVYSNNSNVGVHEIKKAISISGTLSQSDYTINLDNNRDPQGPNGTSNEYGWNFIPNRFASNIDVGNLIRDVNFIPSYKAIHVWDIAANQYKGINASSLINYNTNTTALDSFINIAPWQAFWVKADSVSQSIQIKNIHRTTSMSNVNIFMKSAPDFMRLNVADKNGNKDQIAVMFALDATENFDGEMDLYKLKSFSAEVPTLYIAENNLDQSATALPYTEKRTVMLKFETFKNNTDYTFSPDFDKFDFMGEVILEDLKTGKITNLRTSNYQFASDTSFKTQRFLLHFHTTTSSTHQNLNNEKTYVYAGENGIEVFFTNNGSHTPGQVYIYNVLGQQVYHNDNVKSGANIQFKPETDAKQVYMINIISNGISKTHKVIF